MLCPCCDIKILVEFKGITMLTNWDKSHFNLDKPGEKKFAISKNYVYNFISDAYSVVFVPNLAI